MENTRYILVTGGVISGIGKGILASSVGTMLKSYGIRVTAIKIDPYINVDAGTFSPYEHGEVYVLDDGGEVDLDLGNYERFLDVTLTRDNNITTGKIYKDVIDRERRGDYLGKTVQVVPHITDAIQGWVQRVATIPVDGDERKPQVCIIELGGTIGDIEGMPFVEAFRQFQFRIGADRFAVMHLSLVPQPKTTGEQKTKPTQASVRQLRGLGLSPDLVVCRTTTSLTQESRQKVSTFCQVYEDQVIDVHDVSSVYRVPLMLEEQGVASFLFRRLSMDAPAHRPRRLITRWKYLADRYDNTKKEVDIAVVGKYTKFEDSYASVVRALRHSAMACNRKINIVWIEASDLESETLRDDPQSYHEAWKRLCATQGVLVPGGFGDRGIGGMLAACRWCRERAVPFLGVCLGLQCATIEFARSVLGWEDAHSTEMQPSTTHPVVIDMPEHTSGDLGGTMRLGQRTTIFTDADCKIRKLYNDSHRVKERHRHRYEVNPVYVADLEREGFRFVGHSEDNQRQEIMELDNHPYFVAVQFHPEYLSRPLKPSAPYLGLILAACGKLQTYLNHGGVLSSHCSFTAITHGFLSDDEEEVSSDEELALLTSRSRITTPGKPSSGVEAQKKSNVPQSLQVNGRSNGNLNGEALAAITED